MKVLIVDGYAEADFLIGSLLEKKHKVVVINNNLQQSKYLADIHDIPVFHGDASKQYILDEAHIKNFDLVVTLNTDDATNLIVCQTVKKIYGIKKAVSIVRNPQSVEIFKMLGVNSAISSAHLVATSIEQVSNIENLSKSLSLVHGSLAVNEIVIDSMYPVCGKKIMEIFSGNEINISCIVRDTDILVPRGNTIIHDGDVLIVVSKADEVDNVMKILTGSNKAQVK